MKMRTLTFLTLIIVLAFGLTGCNRDSDSAGDTPSKTQAFFAITEADLTGKTPKKPYTIALVAKKQTDPYYSEIVEAAQKQAAESKVTLQVTYGDSAADQEAQIKKAIEAKPDALLIIPADSKLVAPVLAEAVNQKITVVHLADTVHPTALAKANVKLSGFVGNDNIVAGKLAVPFYKAMEAKGSYLKLRSTIKNTTGSERADGTMAANHGFGGLRPALDQPVEETAEVKPLVEKALHDNPKLVGVIATDDTLAMEAKAALGSKSIPVFGFGGSKKALDAVQSGQLTGTINCHPDRIGADAVLMAIGLLNGDVKTPARLVLPAEVVMKSGSGG